MFQGIFLLQIIFVHLWKYSKKRKISSWILFSGIDDAIKNLDNVYTKEEKLISTDK